MCLRKLPSPLASVEDNGLVCWKGGGERGLAGGPVHPWGGHCSASTDPQRADPGTNTPRVLGKDRPWQGLIWDIGHLSDLCSLSFLLAGKRGKVSPRMVGDPSAASSSLRTGTTEVSSSWAAPGEGQQAPFSCTALYTASNRPE